MDNYNKKDVDFILEHEPVIDSLEEAITVYLTKMSEKNMTKEMSNLHTGLIHACNDIERIGDHAEIIAKRVRSMREDGTTFSPEANREMKELEVLVVSAATKLSRPWKTMTRTWPGNPWTSPIRSRSSRRPCGRAMWNG